MFERFTDRSRRVLVLAQEEARQLNHGFIGTEHILLGLLGESDGVAARALTSLGVTLRAARTLVDEAVGTTGTPPSGSPPFTPRAKKVLELSLRESLQLGRNYIGTEHILLGIAREGDGVAAQVLVALGADLGRVRSTVMGMVVGTEGDDDTAGPVLSSVGQYRFFGQAAWIDGTAIDAINEQLVEISARLERIEWLLEQGGAAPQPDRRDEPDA
jgi:ATP-dependent Clp protease ATP-binding subunit ClpC